MIRIGDFARLARVSVETLRHYDEVGLLPPARVDRSTGYRYYEPAQLVTVYRILVLKEIGLSLVQIAHVLDGGDPETVDSLLQAARDEAERGLLRAQERLQRIDARLQQLKEDGAMPEYEVILKEVPATLAASCRVTVPTNDQVPLYLARAFDAAYAHVLTEGAKDTGPCQAVWHQPAAVLANEEVDAVVPIDRSIRPGSEVAVQELPGGLVAAAVHRGPFTGMTAAHAALLSWIEANGYESNGTYREVYVQGSPAAPEENVTEIQYPVRRAGS